MAGHFFNFGGTGRYERMPGQWTSFTHSFAFPATEADPDIRAATSITSQESTADHEDANTDHSPLQVQRDLDTTQSSTFTRRFPTQQTVGVANATWGRPSNDPSTSRIDPLSSGNEGRGQMVVSCIPETARRRRRRFQGSFDDSSANQTPGASTPSSANSTQTQRRRDIRAEFAFRTTSSEPESTERSRPNRNRGRQTTSRRHERPSASSESERLRGSFSDLSVETEQPPRQRRRLVSPPLPSISEAQEPHKAGVLSRRPISTSVSVGEASEKDKSQPKQPASKIGAPRARSPIRRNSLAEKREIARRQRIAGTKTMTPGTILMRRNGHETEVNGFYVQHHQPQRVGKRPVSPVLSFVRRIQPTQVLDTDGACIKAEPYRFKSMGDNLPAKYRRPFWRTKLPERVMLGIQHEPARFEDLFNRAREQLSAQPGIRPAIMQGQPSRLAAPGDAWSRMGTGIRTDAKIQIASQTLTQSPSNILPETAEGFANLGTVVKSSSVVNATMLLLEQIRRRNARGGSEECTESSNH